MKYQLPAEARPFVLFQRTELLPKKPTPGLLRRALGRLLALDDGYQAFVGNYALSEPKLIDEQYFSLMSEKASSLLPYIPSKTASILDIGCGIAALDLVLYRNLRSPKLYLLDKSISEDRIWYEFKDKGAFYNSLDLAKNTLLLNGVVEDKIEVLEAPDDGVIKLPEKSVDLVVSTISWGFHYPVSTYLKSVVRILSETGILIIDIRRDTGGEAELEEYFSVEIIDEQRKYLTLRCTSK